MSVDTRGIDHILKALKDVPKVRIGILGSKTQRSSAGTQTNAEIGARHEYGIGVARRSFLRMPLQTQFAKRMESAGAFDEAMLKQMVKDQSFRVFADKMAALGLSIVQEAFHTGGFGQWPAWKNSSYMNNSGQLLVDTAQLRDSITAEVR